jgi:Transposase DDE domain
VSNRNKRQYRTRNWRDYNSALVRRGSLTLWVEERAVGVWLNQDRPARRGWRRVYTDVAISRTVTEVISRFR